MAIDTDCYEFERDVTALEKYEKLKIVDEPKIDIRYNVAERRSDFTKSWITPDFSTHFCGYGANQNRQVMRAKLFDRDCPVSQEENVMHWIDQALNNIVGGGVYPNITVKIIAGICGGTGGGGLVEMAHLVRRVARNIRGLEPDIIGYVMLPDVMEHIATGLRSCLSMHANGYATLKELDYYYSVSQRDELFKDYFYTNSDSVGFAIDRQHPLYDALYLVSKSNAPADRPNLVTESTLATALAYQLAETNVTGVWNWVCHDSRRHTRQLVYADTFYGHGEERNGRFGEDTHDYGAIGVATAGIPKYTVKNYVIARMMKTLFGNGNGFVAQAEFNAFDRDACTEQVAGEAIGELLSADVESVTRYIIDAVQNVMKWKVDPNKVPIGVALEDSYLPSHAFDDARCRVEGWLFDKYIQFKQELRIFLLQYGPAAYRDMWEGHDSRGVAYTSDVQSLKTAIENCSAYECRAFHPELKEMELHKCWEKAMEPILGHLHSRIVRCHYAYLELKRENLAQELANYVFGHNGTQGVYATLYLDKIKRMSEAIVEFSYVLEKLYYTYGQMGENFATYGAFYTAHLQEPPTFVNVINSLSDYNWVKDNVDADAAHINFEELKVSLIDSFLNAPEEWIEVDTRDRRLAHTPRKKLDTLIAPYVSFTDNLNVTDFLIYKSQQQGGNLQGDIKRIVNQMACVSRPLYNGEVNANGFERGYSLFMAPQVMYQNLAISPAFGVALQEAEHTIGVIGRYSEGIHGNAAPDQLIMFRVYHGLPLYALHDLQMWQDAYDRSDRHMIHANESNKGIYNEETGLAWKDYPALVLSHNPEQAGPDGRLSREGMFYRDILTPLFKEALSQGVIVRDVNERGEIGYHCNLLQVPEEEPGRDYSVKFDLDGYNKTDENGCYVKGDALFERIQWQNENTPWHNEREIRCLRLPIKLLDQECFTEGIKDEALAELRAKRVLRRNVPMYLAVKKTLRLMHNVFEEIDQRNK